MYFVNRSEIEKTITYLDTLLNEMDNHLLLSTTMEKLGVERLAHVAIESILDVGNLMIDGFIMRDPGSYHDIIDILIDEKVLPKQDEMAYKELIDLRQMLVNDYLSVDHKHILKTISKNNHTHDHISRYIRTYLDNELGFPNAFANEKEEGLL